VHSAQGTQFGSEAWRRFCRSNHLEPNMSRKGTRWDNAVAESFLGSLKKERIKKQICKNRALATAISKASATSSSKQPTRHDASVSNKTLGTPHFRARGTFR
jgi:putative transposase